MPPLTEFSDEQIDEQIHLVSDEIDRLRAHRRPLLAERNRRQLRQSALLKLRKLTPEEQAALRLEIGADA